MMMNHVVMKVTMLIQWQCGADLYRSAYSLFCKTMESGLGGFNVGLAAQEHHWIFHGFLPIFGDSRLADRTR
jgi:hypothetical protein